MRVGLLYKLLCSVWAMRPDAAEAYYPLVGQVLMGENRRTWDDEGPARPKSEAEHMAEAGIRFATGDGRLVAAHDVRRDIDPTERNLVAVVPVRGPIMMDDYCGDYGMRRMGNWLREFDADPSISGTVLELDTPGGDGTAMFMMSDALKGLTKPVVGRTDYGQACSAGIGIGASCDLLFAGNEIDELGSIGTYVTLTDWAGYMKSKGLNVHSIYATLSTEKNAHVREALQADPSNAADPKYDRIRKNYIDPFNQRFIDRVKSSRPGVKDEKGMFNGAVFEAKEAEELGLVDGVGVSLQEAIGHVRSYKKTPNK